MVLTCPCCPAPLQFLSGLPRNVLRRAAFVTAMYPPAMAGPIHADDRPIRGLIGAGLGAMLQRPNLQRPPPAANRQQRPRSRQPQRKPAHTVIRADPHHVRSVRETLNDPGYDAGPVDGQPGQRTRRAVAAFQRDYGLTRIERIRTTLLRSIRDNAGHALNEIERQRGSRTVRGTADGAGSFPGGGFAGCPAAHPSGLDAAPREGGFAPSDAAKAPALRSTHVQGDDPIPVATTSGLLKPGERPPNEELLARLPYYRIAYGRAGFSSEADMLGTFISLPGHIEYPVLEIGFARRLTAGERADFETGLYQGRDRALKVQCFDRLQRQRLIEETTAFMDDRAQQPKPPPLAVELNCEVILMVYDFGSEGYRRNPGDCRVRRRCFGLCRTNLPRRIAVPCAAAKRPGGRPRRHADDTFTLVALDFQDPRTLRKDQAMRPQVLRPGEFTIFADLQSGETLWQHPPAASVGQYRGGLVMLTGNSPCTRAGLARLKAEAGMLQSLKFDAVDVRLHAARDLGQGLPGPDGACRAAH